MLDHRTVIRLSGWVYSVALLFVPGLEASAATITAASTWSGAVQAAINSATNGDTVVVPAGSAIWTTAVTISGKALSLTGNGIGSTVIIDGTTSSALGVSASTENFIRISGFTFISGGTHTSSGIVDLSGPQGQVAFRFDHNQVLITSAVTRGVTVTSVYGLIDHCQLSCIAAGAAVQLISIWGSDMSTDFGFTPWTRPLSLGSINAVYIEDCGIYERSGAQNGDSAMDAYSGARWVLRHCSITNNECCSGHGCDSGSSRSMHSFECYSNSYVNIDGIQQRGGTIRGGTGVIYGNTYSGSWGGIALMYYRASIGLAISAWGRCDGTQWKLSWDNSTGWGCSSGGTRGFSGADNETWGTWGGIYTNYFDGPAAAHGYPGRDQPGITTGQLSDPIYVWNNGSVRAGTYDGGGGTVYNLGIEYWVQSGRDYINNGSTPKPGYTPLVYPHPLISGVVSGTSTNAIILLASSTVDFGSVQAGATNDASVTVRNLGGGILAGVATVVAPFSIVSGGTYSLGSNQSQQVTLRYAPQVAGSYRETVTFTGGGGAFVTVTGSAN